MAATNEVMTSSEIIGIGNRHGLSSQKTKTGLLDLPPEIWSKICKLAVESNAPVKAFGDTRRRHYPKTPEEHFIAANCREWEYVVCEPAILFTCRAVREERLIHYYETNTFYAPRREMNLRYIERWFNAIGDAGRAGVRGIYYRTHLKETFLVTFEGRELEPLDLWSCPDEEIEELNQATGWE